MEIITVTHSKGGVGKTTLVFNLYNFYKLEGLKVAIIDIDIQGSLLAAKAAYKDDFADINILSTPKNWDSILSFDYDIILIDTPPFKMAGLEKVLKVSTVCLIPTKYSLYDRLAIPQTVNIVNEVLKINKVLVCCVVLTQTIPNSSYVDVIRESFADTGALVLNETIGNRVAFSRTSFNATGVFSESDNKAKTEISQLGERLLDLRLENK